ncbi:hypothetical protein KSB_36950 [Ktedonobacter robiniae]|uniref:Uncharacterized protein n=1 Tax=Ktedonobacter robiniae TaxID=2778365 RepID=A0ABQ3URZ7_9CHLR|nr:hypothetical protein KSB_36950 [Ktedonobacter robiniae]
MWEAIVVLPDYSFDPSEDPAIIITPTVPDTTVHYSTLFGNIRTLDGGKVGLFAVQ